MIKSHQIRIYPTKAQDILLKKSCGCARHSYNWALSKWKEQYESGEKPSAYSLIKLQNSIKKEEMPFYLSVSKNAPQYAIHHLELAFKRFFKDVKDGTIESSKKKYIHNRKSKGLPIDIEKLKQIGRPNFKKKGVNDSFVAVENNRSFNQTNFKIHIPRIGKIKCAENLRFEGKVNNVVVKRIADKWFAVVNVEVEMPTDIQTVSKNHATVGIDVGISKMMVLSDGTIYENPRALKSNLKQLQRVQRGLTRKVKGSKNRKKQQIRLAKKYYRISCIRKNAIHQATTEIVTKYDRIIVEDLNLNGMLKNHKLSQALGDVSFGEIVRQLAYKCAWNSKELVKADRYYPSSKNCSNCGNKKEKLALSQRVYKCDNCGFVCDRDLNAAKNLAKYSPTPKSGEREACGERLVETQRASMKQEIDILNNCNIAIKSKYL